MFRRDRPHIRSARGRSRCFLPTEENSMKALVRHGNGKIVSAVCRGPVGFMEAKLSDGSWLVQDRNLTAFSWAEEKADNRDDIVPFNLEEELKARGARYAKALMPFGKHIVEDGRFITGQNPASARGVGEAVALALREAATKNSRRRAFSGNPIARASFMTPRPLYAPPLCGLPNRTRRPLPPGRRVLCVRRAAGPARFPRSSRRRGRGPRRTAPSPARVRRHIRGHRSAPLRRRIAPRPAWRGCGPWP